MNSKTALVIVDPQNDFCPGGKLGVPGGDEVIPILNHMIALAQERGWPVYISRDWHPCDTTHFADNGGPWPRHCEQDTHGASFHPDLSVPDDAIIVTKGISSSDDGYSAFEGITPAGLMLADDLRGRTDIIICGLATDYCVRETVLSALDEGLHVTLITDAIRGIDANPGDVDAAIERMTREGAKLSTSADLPTRESAPSKRRLV